MIARRTLLSLAAGLWPVSAYAAADPREAVLTAMPPARTAAGRRWVSPPDCYFAYPHSNSFVPESGLPVIARIEGETIVLCIWDGPRNTVQDLVRTGLGDMYWDVALRAGTLFFVAGRKLIVSLPTAPARKPADYAIHHEAGQKLEGLLSVSADAGKVLYMEEVFAPDQRSVQAASLHELDMGTGGTTQFCAMQFSADHQQYCPYDENWIGFAHEGDIRKTLDRVWGFYRGGTDTPRILWHEIAADGQPLLVGHERWAFHAAGALAVAYPGSAGHPCGLYFIEAPTRAARLVSASAYDWHCNISRDGQWAVVDTKPPPGQPTEADGRIISDIVLVHMATGQRQWVARSHASPAGHPWHPHPHFSPDGRCVIYNDFAAAGAGTPGRVVMVELAPDIPV